MRWIWICVSCLIGAPAAAGEAAVRFDTDVMAVLSRAGCNMGACHGNSQGKGNLRLSLRGQDPQFDHRQLTRGDQGRRIDRLAPEQSLMLLKPTGRASHQGGVRFAIDSLEHRLIADWIRSGAPGPDRNGPRLVSLSVTPSDIVLPPEQSELPLQAMAEFSDGGRRNVTELAVFESASTKTEVSGDGVVHRVDYGPATVVVRFLDRQAPVRIVFLPPGGRPWNGDDFTPRNYIDVRLMETWRRLGVAPAPRCSDEQFVRRLHLDLLGVPPTAERARRFAAEQDPRKRDRLIDEVLARPELADRWALHWSDLLRNEEKVLDRRGVETYHRWIRESMASGVPLDEFARSLVSARGSSYRHPPANYYRAARTPSIRGETTAQVFLGIRLQCAQCHNHPFDLWTQDDYYGWSALFARVDYEIVDNKRRDRLDKHEFIGEQIVKIKSDGEVQNPRTGRDAMPKFLERSAGADGQAAAGPAAQRPATKGLDGAGDRLQRLGRWLPEQRQFARMQANRIWSQVMGRGLVEPVDDFRITNPPSHPQLLEALADDLIAGGYDLRHLVRRIVQSRAYQLSARPRNAQPLAADPSLFASAVLQRLAAESLLDAQCVALDWPARFEGYDQPLRAGQIPGVRAVRARESKPQEGDRFLRAFGKPERLLACECERSSETTLKQALMLVADRGLDARLAEPRNRLNRLLSMAPGEAVDTLYWAALSRPPSDEERSRGEQLLREAPSREALEDLAWALLNSKEFVFRH